MPAMSPGIYLIGNRELHFRRSSIEEFAKESQQTCRLCSRFHRECVLFLSLELAPRSSSGLSIAAHLHLLPGGWQVINKLSVLEVFPLPSYSSHYTAF